MRCSARRTPRDGCACIDPLTRVIRMLSYAELSQEWDGAVILVSRRVGVGIDPKTFGFHWFLPSLWRYRKPLAYVLVASLFIQLFALVTPLFFQIVVDKVLVHKGTSTLIVRHHRHDFARAVPGDAAISACLHPVAFG